MDTEKVKQDMRDSLNMINVVIFAASEDEESFEKQREENKNSTDALLPKLVECQYCGRKQDGIKGFGVEICYPCARTRARFIRKFIEGLSYEDKDANKKLVEDITEEFISSYDNND